MAGEVIGHWGEGELITVVLLTGHVVELPSNVETHKSVALRLGQRSSVGRG